MISFFKKYKAFGIGAFIVTLALIILEKIGFIKIPDNAPLELVFIFGFWWLVVSLCLYHFDYFKKKKKTVFKVIVLFIIAMMTFGTDSYFNIPDHPLVIFLIVLFWLGIFYLFFPSFFIKYRYLILFSYGLILCYFFYIRTDTNYEALYHQRVFNLLIFPIPILLCIWLYEQWKWFKTLKSEKAKAELELLKTQVNPHFLFNTLNNLYALTVKNSEKAPDVILKLSDMMRYTIYEGKNETVPLKGEIAYLKNYIDLHKIRHHKKVTIQFEHTIVDDDKIAPLLFIILLENAFKHGVEKLTQDAYINMSLVSDATHIYFTIENNYEESDTSEEGGIGIENLKKRLALIYPNAHSLKIDKKTNVFKVDLMIYKP